MTAETDLWRCTVCGQVSTVGRCCGEETREPFRPIMRKDAEVARRIEAFADRAEQLEAEIEALRAEAAEAAKVLRGALDFSTDGEPLRVLAIRASNALYWRNERAERAEARADKLLAAAKRLTQEVGRLQQQYDERTACVIAHRGSALACSDAVRSAYSDERRRADRLAEALRELVEVFSESGMYDEEVFDKARAALSKEEGK